jgi:hypothetical protein
MSPGQYVHGIDEVNREAGTSGEGMAKIPGEVQSTTSEEAATRLFDSFLKQGTATYARMFDRVAKVDTASQNLPMNIGASRWWHKS